MLKLTIYNLSVKIETNDYTLQNHIKHFLDKFYTIKQASFSPNVPEQYKVFAGKIKDKGIWQLHSTQFVHLYHYLKEINFPLAVSEKIDERDYHVIQTDFKVRDGWELREDQVPAYEFLTNNPVKSKLIPMQMGDGKTLTSLVSIATLKKRLAVVILSRFCQKWCSDITTVHNANSKDVMLIQGSKHLIALINLAKAGELNHDYFVFSAETIQSYISSYEEDPESCVEIYGCSPMELFPLLGIGIMLNDESHMSFHLVFKIIIYTNIEYQIGLTATLISDDHVVRRMHKVIYPQNCIYDSGGFKKYTDIYPISYTIGGRYMGNVKTKNFGSNNYSHTAFEQSITRKPDSRLMYCKLIKSVMDDYYISDYKDNDKAIIFVATIKFATELVSYLKEQYPNKDVRRYCEDDPYEDLMNAEIIVSTVLSAGTGVDIPNLRIGIQTVSISSSASNLQTFGRLRKLKDRDVKFCYLYCENIGKQKEYHLKRMELFKDRAANIVIRRSRTHIF